MVTILLLTAVERHTIAPAFVLVPIAVGAVLWLLWAFFPRLDPDEIPDRDAAFGSLLLALLRLADRLVDRYELWASSRSRRRRDANARGPFGQGGR